MMHRIGYNVDSVTVLTLQPLAMPQLPPFTLNAFDLTRYP